MLDHKQRNILEDVAVVQTVAATQDMFALPCKVIGEAYARTKVFVVVMRELRVRAANVQQFEVSSALGNRAGANQVKIFVPANT